MTIELTYLTLAAMLTTSLWIPYIVGVNKNPVSDVDGFHRPAPLGAFPAWVHRAHRAHLNHLETLAPFAIVVLIAHLANVSSTVTVVASVAFFWLRAPHAVGMIAGFARMPLRPILFTAAWVCILAIGVATLLA